MLLLLDTWDGVHVSFQETENPSRAQVLAAIDRLDSKLHTEASIRRDNPFEYLSIAGGPSYFLIAGETRDEAFVQLTSPEAGEGTVKLTCGGQWSEFSLRDVVPRTKVEPAVDQFFAGLSAELPQPWAIK